jgi:AraC-like DNA-binding protein
MDPAEDRRPGAATGPPCGPSDTLSAVLEAVRLTGAVFFLVDGAAPWVAEAPTSRQLAPTILPDAQHVVSYHVMTEGSCWCESPGQEPIRLEAGDVLLVPHGDAYQLASRRGLRTGWSLEQTLGWFREMAAGRLPFVVTEGGSSPERLRIICGFLGCDASPFNPVLAALPPLTRVRLDPDSVERLRTLLALAVAESARTLPGSRSMLRRVAELVFVEVLRSHLAAAEAGPGWLGGLRDPLVGRALACLHAAPARAWTLQALAHEVGASRSVLAERFASLVGHPPMAYLTQWRMQLASGQLARGAAPVRAVAAEVGYESEAAFCRAFRKITGVTPAAWRGRSRT